MSSFLDSVAKEFNNVMIGFLQFFNNLCHNRVFYVATENFFVATEILPTIFHYVAT